MKAVINKLENTALPIFFMFFILTVNGQVTSQNNTTKQDSVPAAQVEKDSLGLQGIQADTIKPVVSPSDTIKKVPPKPIKLEKNKKYVLGGVSVVGNETISEQSILIFSGLSPGQQIKIPGDKLSSSIKRLWSSKLFSNVDVYVTQLDGEAVYLEINVKELDKVGKLRITGLKKSKIEDLEKEIEFQPGSMLTENLITTTENYIKDKYREKGYLKTKVTINTRKDTSLPNTQDALISIDRGNKIKIKNIRFHGNTAFSDKKLKKTMKKTKEKGITRIFSPSKFVEDLYEEDLDMVVELFQEKGFRDALILKDSISWNEDNTINLDIFMTQGQRYKFGTISFLGNTVFTDQQLQSILRIDKGVTYNGKALNERVYGDGTPESQDITNTYLDNGYLFSRVNAVETSAANNTIDLEIRIIEDEPATIRKVTVKGNDVTNDHVIFREIRTKPGDLFSKSDIVRSIRELGQLGFIDPENIVPDVQPNFADKTTDIEFSVSEKGSSQIELQGGYGGGTFVGTLGLSFNNFAVRNLFNFDEYKPVPRGDGQTVALRLQVSKFYRTYSLSFSEPWMGGKKPKGFNFSIYNSSQFGFDPFTNDVDKDQLLDIIGASVGLSQRLKWPDDFFTLSTSLNYQRFKLKNYTISSFDFDNGISNNFNFAVNFGRSSAGPNPVFPSGGSQFNVLLKLTPPYSLFDDKDYTDLPDEEKYKWIEFYKIVFTGKWYSPVVGKLVLMSNAELGFLGYYNDEIGAPPFERFYVGGDGMQQGRFDGRTTIALRGYPNSSLSSQTGGTIYNKVAFELRYPITLKPSASIYALSFLEGGNSWNEFEEYRPFTLKRSAGAGLRVFMPAFGLLGVDFGYGFDTIPGSNQISGWQTHFIIGQQF
ncbi:outer membrane protein assembly factor BamA [Lutimonas saemankumensis]|nr:outer membrane protein assembly factor BamA [Lutimonas saemankumensis]MCA0933524.1 outer membrane protein assembly factor BamA [Lutimonas saemankumensis]